MRSYETRAETDNAASQATPATIGAQGVQMPPEAASQMVDTLSLPGRWVRIDQALVRVGDKPDAVWKYFDAQTPALMARPVTAGGRAAAWFVRVDGFDAVLRDYRRGGLVARFVQDRYFWTGLQNTRAFREFDLMRTLWREGLPVPRPLGAAVWKRGLTYRAALLTQRIPDAQPLAHTTEQTLWKRAGVAIAAMHRFGVWHADLNVFNVLCDAQGKIWLIDFDRGRLETLPPEKRAENLSRLLRSAKKIGDHQYQVCWHALNESYQAAWNAEEQLK